MNYDRQCPKCKKKGNLIYGRTNGITGWGPRMCPDCKYSWHYQEYFFRRVCFQFFLSFQFIFYILFLLISSYAFNFRIDFSWWSPLPWFSIYHFIYKPYFVPFFFDLIAY